MAGGWKSAYGIDVFPEKSTPIDIELACYRHHDLFQDKFNGKLMPAYEHFINATRMLFSNDQLTWNSWTEEHARLFCKDDFAIIWGPAAAGKSNDFGAFCVVDWWADPLNTYTAICSTTSSMLRKRIWESVQRYHGYHRKDCPGIHRPTDFAITLDYKHKKETEDEAKKAGIHGFAVMAGTAEQTQANIVGVHLPRVRLLVDEMQSTRRAAVDARHNLSKATDDFKFIGLCNPDSFLNIAGEYSEPLDGWDSISVETHHWKTKWGDCYHYDGHKSPAVLEENGAEKYPFLINQKDIDKGKQEGEDSTNYWIYIRGYPPPSGVSNTVMNESECNAWDVYGITKWRADQRIRMATLDPAFGGKDKCKLYIWEGGFSLDGRYTVECIDSLSLDVRVGLPRPPTYQIADQVRDYAAIYNFDAKHLAVDESVTQSVGDVIDMVWERGVHRVNFGAKPLQGVKSADSNLRCEDEYRNLISMLYLQFALYCQYGQIKGLPKQAARNMCTRIVEEGKPTAIESKKFFKKRMGSSPDDGDCCAMLAFLLRKVIGIVPGALHSAGGRGGSISNNTAQYYDVDSSNGNYLNTGL